MKQCREYNCPLQDICRGAVDNETWWNISDDCEIFAFVSAQADKIFALENRLKECENGYEGTLHLESCKLHDAEEKVKELTQANEQLSESYDHLEKTKDELLAERSRLTEENERLRKNLETFKGKQKLLQKQIEVLAKENHLLLSKNFDITVGDCHIVFSNGKKGNIYTFTEKDKIAKEMLEGEK